jgi:hypothetical protein
MMERLDCAMAADSTMTEAKIMNRIYSLAIAVIGLTALSSRGAAAALRLSLFICLFGHQIFVY